MDRYTQETREWLDIRFSPEAHRHLHGAYKPYQPLHGIPDEEWGPGPFLMASRLVRLFALLDGFKFESFLDVGGAEGMISRMVRDRYGVASASVDLSFEAAQRAVEYSGVAAAAVDSARLPFADQSFDVIFLSEVLEHLANPVRSLLECRRVARRAVIVTTEAFASNEAERQEELDERELSAHMDRSIFCPEDFDRIFCDWTLDRTNQCSALPDPWPLSNAKAAHDLSELTEDLGLDHPAHGIVVFAGRAMPAPSPLEHRESAVAFIQREFAPQSVEPQSIPADQEPSSELCERLVCPRDQSAFLRIEGGELIFEGGARYPYRGGAADLVTAPGDDFSSDLKTTLEGAIPEHSDVRDALYQLAEKLRFDLPIPITERRHFFDVDSEWSASPGCQIEQQERGISVLAECKDPQLLSPYLLIPTSEVKGFRLQVRAMEAEKGLKEELQLYWHTLRRPLWWAGASWNVEFPVDGDWASVEVLFEEALPAGENDELLRLRLDPAHGRGRFEIRDFEILA